MRRRPSEMLPSYGVGDEVGVVLDLDNRVLRFELNGERVAELSGAAFPPGDRPIFPVVVLDEVGDTVDLLPGDAPRIGLGCGASRRCRLPRLCVSLPLLPTPSPLDPALRVAVVLQSALALVLSQLEHGSLELRLVHARGQRRVAEQSRPLLALLAKVL